MLFFLFLQFVSIYGHLTDQQIEAATKVAVCRAHCIDGFSHRFLTLTNSQCEFDADCFMCWENCDMFYRSFDIWGSICNDPVVCFDGCRLACAAYNKDRSELPAKSDPWSFSGDVLVDQNVRLGYLNLQWSQPLPVYSVEPPLPRVIFVVFWHSADGWIQVNQTVTNSYFTKNSNIVTDSSLKMLILAVTRDGAVCQLEYSAKVTKYPSDVPRIITTRDYLAFTNPPDTSLITQTDVTFVVGVVIAVVVSALLLIFGIFFGWKILKEQRRNYLLRRANALKIKRSVRSSNRSQHSMNGSRANLLKIETISNSCMQKFALDPPSICTNFNDIPTKLPVSKTDSNVPFVLTILERPEGIDEVKINHEILKKKLEEQKSIFV